MHLRRFIKFLHTIGAIGFAGGIAAYIVVAGAAPELAPTAEFAAHRGSIADISRWIVMPSMVLVLTSGLVALAIHYPFQNQGWVWVKALLGLLVFEASLASIDGPAQRGAAAALSALNGEMSTVELATRVYDKWGALYMLLAISVVNVILAIWRPRFGKPVSHTETLDPDSYWLRGNDR